MFKTVNLRKGRHSQPWAYYAVTINTENRKPFFTDLNINQILANCLQQMVRDNTINLIAFTIMPDHLHMIFQLGDKLTLSRVVRCFKGNCVSRLRTVLPQTKKIWQKGYYDRCIRDERELKTQARYVIANPLRKGLCNQIGDYPYWDCIYLNQVNKELL